MDAVIKPIGAIPVVIVGAGRSGTNMLRDILVQMPGFGTWPCDEINYIWRHGNINLPTDELTIDHARPEVVSFVRAAFGKLAKKSHLTHIVEKTCANSLRLEFVSRILPEAKYIHIVRNGRDVVASAVKRWKAPLDLLYILEKSRFVPITDAPYYAARYFQNRIYKFRSQEKRLSFWGPRFIGMDELLRTHSLEEVCAYQWMKCIQRTEEALSRNTDIKSYRFRYEDFVISPEDELSKIMNFLDIKQSDDFISKCVTRVKRNNVDKASRELDAETLARVEAIINTMQSKLGY